jgi:serine/threonine protein kinase
MHPDSKPEKSFVNSQTLDITVGDFGSALTDGSAAAVILMTGGFEIAIHIWADGCIFGEIVTGRPPFAEKTRLINLTACAAG